EVVVDRSVGPHGRAGRGPVEDTPQQPHDVGPRGVVGELDERHAEPAGGPSDLAVTSGAAAEDDTAAADPAGRLDEGHRGLRRLDADAEQEVTGLAVDPGGGLGKRDVVDLGPWGVDGDPEQPPAEGPDDVGDGKSAGTGGTGLGHALMITAGLCQR